MQKGLAFFVLVLLVSLVGEVSGADKNKQYRFMAEEWSESIAQIAPGMESQEIAW